MNKTPVARRIASGAARKCSYEFRSRVDLLSADVGDYDGLLVNFGVGLNYQVFEHAGFGLNYNYFKLDIGIDKSSWRGDIETVFKGIYVYASFYY
jgi:hypothetical protein